MHHRQLIALVGSFLIAGYLGLANGNSRGIAYADLPAEARKEVRIAYEKSEYTACDSLVLMDEFENLGDAVVRYEGRTYEIIVAVGDRGPNAECRSTYSLELVPA